MTRLLVYYAHPGHRHSRLNRELAAVAASVADISFVDLYAAYPRHEIDVAAEQSRLLEHDVMLFQFPLFWYSVPSLLKEWIDLVLEHGFAYGKGGDKLLGKRMMAAVSAGSPEEAYAAHGFQRHPLRTYLLPLEQTAVLCHLEFTPPYTLYGALKALDDALIEPHAEGYRTLLESVRDDRFDFDAAKSMDVLRFDSLPMRKGH